MAPKNILLLAAVLLSVLAAAAASVGTSCQPGMAIPHNPLRSCRPYVLQRACGLGGGPPPPHPYDWTSKALCCQELAAIPEYCRCSALLYFMDGVVTSSGVFEGRLLEDLPGCPRERQRGFAATLTTPEECNLGTIHGGPYCLSLTGGDRRDAQY
ncbi:hypothetical protein ABZP36_002397 [Zizania latifolia]